jgi:hypothetical protein
MAKGGRERWTGRQTERSGLTPWQKLPNMFPRDASDRLAWTAVIGAKIPLIAVYVVTGSADKAVLTWCGVLSVCLLIKAVSGVVRMMNRPTRAIDG